MKSLFNFLREATTSAAAQQAARMGLRSDGHGGWYDERGEFVAKTVGGRLEFFNSNQNPDGRDPNQSEADKRTSGEESAGGAALGTRTKETEGATQAQAEKGAVAPQANATSADQSAVAQAASEEEPTGPAPVEKTKGTLTIAFGRFNPPTSGHGKLLDTVADASDDGDYIIVPSRSEDKKKNPLNPDEKVGVMQQAYPKHADKIVNDPANRTIFDVLRKAHNDGYANVRVVGGGDRVNEYEKLVNKYNGSTYEFENIEVVNAGDRDPDADGVEGMSASKMRDAARDNDFRAFKKGMPDGMTNDQVMSAFALTQKRMGITPKEPAVAEAWEIAPRLDPQGLREAYIQGEIFNVGDIVTHDSTGMGGEIVRKCTNYLICVTEDGKMFKTWTRDVSMGPGGSSSESTPKEREVGTDSLRAFLQRLTPGEKVQSFINKNNK